MLVVRDASFLTRCAGAVPELCRSCAGSASDLVGDPKPSSS